MTKAEEYERMMAAYYRNLAGLGGPDARRPNSVSMDPLGISRPKPHTPPGATNIRYGVEPTVAEVKQFIRNSGGNPYAKKGKGKKKSTGTGKAKGSPLKDILKEMSADVKRQQNRANAANRSRFNSVLTGRVDARNDTLEYLQGQGQYQEQLARDGSKDNLAKIQAYLNSHGLTHSSILPAYMQKASKDLELQLMGQREAQMERMAEVDARAREGIFDFVERKTERGPDTSNMAALAAQLGQAEAFNQARQQRAQRPQPQQYIPQGGGGVSPLRAQQMAYSTQQQFNPVGMYQNMVGGYRSAQPVNPSQGWDDSLDREALFRQNQERRVARVNAKQQGRQERMLARRSAQEFNSTFS